jgi:soluble lytic murein transglycosylase-like protein
MRFRLPVLAIALITCVLSAIPARAQLSSYVDEDGNVVYTNVVYTNPASLPGRSATAKSASSASALKAQPIGALTAVPLRPAAPAELDTLVRTTAEKHHVDPDLVRAVIATESHWNASAVSRKGALGLMQLIPDTAQRLGVGNAFDPAQNVDAGVRYLGMLLDRYNGDLSKALAAYNAGPGAVDRFGGVPNFRETRSYVQKVTATYYSPSSAGPGLVPASLVRAGLAAPRLVPQAAPPIYRTQADDGRVVFTNE